MALRSREMNRDEAQELLSQLRPVDQWRRHDGGHSGYDPTSQPAGGQSFPRFNHVTQQMSFPPVSYRIRLSFCTNPTPARVSLTLSFLCYTHSFYPRLVTLGARDKSSSLLWFSYTYNYINYIYTKRIVVPTCLYTRTYMTLLCILLALFFFCVDGGACCFFTLPFVFDHTGSCRVLRDWY